MPSTLIFESCVYICHRCWLCSAVWSPHVLNIFSSRFLVHINSCCALMLSVDIKISDLKQSPPKEHQFVRPWVYVKYRTYTYSTSHIPTGFVRYTGTDQGDKAMPKHPATYLAKTRYGAPVRACRHIVLTEAQARSLSPTFKQSSE